MASNKINYLFMFAGDEDSDKRTLIGKFMKGRNEKLFIGRTTSDIHDFRFRNDRDDVIQILNVKSTSVVEEKTSGVDAVFFCYNSYRRESFVNIDKVWIPALKADVSHKFLVARKPVPDAEQQQEVAVSIKEGVQYAIDNGLSWMSEKENVDRMMHVYFNCPSPTDNEPEDKMEQ